MRLTNIHMVTGGLLLLASMQGMAQSKSNRVEPAAPVMTVAEQMPEYPGGMHEMMMFIQQNVNFPKAALSDTLFRGCKCYIKMVIDTSGRVIDPTVIRGCTRCPDCDAEAMRVVKAMPLWKPGVQSGRKVKVYYMLPINFSVK